MANDDDEVQTRNNRQRRSTPTGHQHRQQTIKQNDTVKLSIQTRLEMRIATPAAKVVLAQVESQRQQSLTNSEKDE